MAGFITFDMNAPGETWATANWIFYGFIDHALSLVDDARTVEELTICRHHQNVDLEDLRSEDPELFQIALEAFRQACLRVASGDFQVSIEGRILDDNSQMQYQEEVSRLAKLLER